MNRIDQVSIYFLAAILYVQLIIGSCAGRTAKKYEISSQEGNSAILTQLQLIEAIYSANKANQYGQVFCDFPIANMEALTGRRYDTINHVSSFCLMDYYLKADDFTAFIYELGCKVGGSCSEFYLITLSPHSVIENTLIGREESSYSSDRYFSFRPVGDYRIEVNEEFEETGEDPQTRSDTSLVSTITISPQGKIFITR